MFVSVVIVVLLLIHGYVAWRIIPIIGISFFQSMVAYTIIFLLSLMPLLPIILRISGSESKLIDRISFFGYTSLGFFTLSFIIFVTKDFIFQLYPLIEGLFHTKQPVDSSKRDFLKKSISIAMIGLAGTATGFGFYSSRKSPTVINQDIFLESLPPGFENFTIAQNKKKAPQCANAAKI